MSFRNKPTRVLKQAIDAEQSRRYREHTSIEIRKKSRNEQLSKRRHMKPSDGEQKEETINLAHQKDQILSVFASNSIDQQLTYVTYLRKLLSSNNNNKKPPIQQIVDFQLVPRLVQFLTYTASPKLQVESAWALTNIVAGDVQHTTAVVEAGAVEIFIQLLRSEHSILCEQSLWALGNIAGENNMFRNHLIQLGTIQHIIDMCQSRKCDTDIQRQVAWILSNLCKGKPPPPFQYVCSTLPLLSELLKSSDEQILADTCWALSYLSHEDDTENNQIQSVIQGISTNILVSLLAHSSDNVIIPALRTVGNIVSGNDVQTQTIIESQALPRLFQLLGNKHPQIRKEACWAISNIAAGNRNQISAVIEAKLIPPLIALLDIDSFDVIKEIIWTIHNITSGGDHAQVGFLVDQGVLKPLCNLLTCNDVNATIGVLEMLTEILNCGNEELTKQTIDKKNIYAEMLEECGGLELLEQLVHHENGNVSRKAHHILQNYFETDEHDNVFDSQLSSNEIQFAFATNGSFQGIDLC